MSLILDALRRAETQRQTQVQPVYSLPSGRRTRSVAEQLPQSTLIGLLAGAVLVTAAAVIWMAIGANRHADQGANMSPFAAAPRASDSAPASTEMARLATPAPSRSAGAPREVTSLSALARADDPMTVRPAAPSSPPASNTGGRVQVVEPTYATSTPATNSGNVTPGTVVVRDLLAEEGITGGGGSIEVASPTPTPAPRTESPVPGAPAPSDAPPTGEVANLDSAPTQFTLNMLSTSPNQANSYVYINMRRYAIGDRTAEGAIVDDISNAGVVIRYRGQRYLLKSR